MTSPVSRTLNNVPYEEVQYGSVEAYTPIVVMVHYMGGNASAMHFILEGFPQALRAIFLQARYSSGDEIGGFSWYPDEEAFYDRSEAEQAPDIRAEADRLAAFLADLKKLYPAKIAVSGMSQGGDLSLALAAYHPELLDMAIPCAGRLSAPMRPASMNHASSVLPLVYLKQGAIDPIVSVESAREAAAWLKSVGYQVELQEYPQVGHDISRDMVKDIQQLLTTL